MKGPSPIPAHRFFYLTSRASLILFSFFYEHSPGWSLPLGLALSLPQQWWLRRRMQLSISRSIPYHQFVFFRNCLQDESNPAITWSPVKMDVCMMPLGNSQELISNWITRLNISYAIKLKSGKCSSVHEHSTLNIQCSRKDETSIAIKNLLY